MIGKYLKYRLKAHYWHGHHVHSPYTYWLMTNVVYERWPYYSFDKIEGLRNKTEVKEKGDLDPAFGQMMQRLCATNNAKSIVQIGCDEGWETMYLASNDSKATVEVEGKISASVHNRLQIMGFNNVKEKRCEERKVDMMVCMESSIRDAFERYAKAMNEGGIMIFKDIHKHEEEWDKVKKDERIRVTMDFYKIGVCWFKSDMQKENYIVKF